MKQALHIKNLTKKYKDKIIFLIFLDTRIDSGKSTLINSISFKADYTVSPVTILDTGERNREINLIRHL